jgi:UDP-glucose 4-epimerase
MKKILVTGGAGFIGTNLIKKLLNEGHEVVSIDNYETGFEINHQAGAVYYKYDIKTIKDFSVFGNFNAVYHLAGLARIQPSFELPTKYFETNVIGTINLSEYCSKHNIPLIYSSSSTFHGGKYVNPYTFSKCMGEDVIKMYREIYNLKSTIVRFYNVYGPHQIKKGEYSTIIGRWEHLIENGLPLTIYGDGNKRRDFTHVDDIVDGLIRIYNREKWGFTFEMGRGENHSINEIADMFNHEKIYLEEKSGEMNTSLCDSTAANIHLSWYPEFNIKDYIKNYLDK